ncbi:YD repeat-containing protein [Pseudomonas mucidolens]|uniref:YD repeat-containing protein n=1 Tax=Pseudomonas mucidolens TaxID=46679 RepID=A0A1H2NF31_9PSED|nr:YD repeat-containing protein [Pseudomonas mucidolens]SQH32074.1 RHS protein [Pseudomonas mucidolens]
MMRSIADKFRCDSTTAPIGYRPAQYRTGLGMNLQWQGEGADAQAIREWADDGSYDTRLEWDENIRLTYVIDALDQETWYYYDILGYTYRVIYPDGNEEWLFRDDAKNVVRHIHTDGSSVDHAYDDQDQLFKTRDPEGNVTSYEYRAGQLVRLIHPDKTEEHFERDAEGRLLTDLSVLRKCATWKCLLIAGSGEQVLGNQP